MIIIFSLDQNASPKCKFSGSFINDDDDGDEKLNFHEVLSVDLKAKREVNCCCCYDRHSNHSFTSSQNKARVDFNPQMRAEFGGMWLIAGKSLLRVRVWRRSRVA